MNYLLVVVIIILSILLVNNKIKIKRISLKLENILKENSTERIKINNLSEDKKELVKYINNLLDKYERVSVDNKNYKEQHKRMMSDISHDIRTPITAIMGYVDLLMDNTLEEYKREEYISVIHERGRALKELMEEFFELSKLEGKDREITIEKVNISEIIRQNLITFMNEIDKREVVPEINIGDEEVFVLGDKSALNRVITNLISNSLKYGYQGKVMGIELRVYENQVEIIVWDRGKGIEKSQIPYIFERLYTEERSRNKKLQGSGLGLTIVKKLVEDMHGDITLSSIPYEKTSFMVRLPKAD